MAHQRAKISATARAGRARSHQPSLPEGFLSRARRERWARTECGEKCCQHHPCYGYDYVWGFWHKRRKRAWWRGRGRKRKPYSQSVSVRCLRGKGTVSRLNAPSGSVELIDKNMLENTTPRSRGEIGANAHTVGCGFLFLLPALLRFSPIPLGISRAQNEWNFNWHTFQCVFILLRTIKRTSARWKQP